MTQITVVKRSGRKEPLLIEKWQAQVAKICQGIADVSQSMIEIKAQLHFYDGITTTEIDGITLRAIVDLIDVETNPDVHATTVEVLKYLSAKSADELMELYTTMLPDIKHNRDRYYEFAKEQRYKMENLFL